MKKHGVLAGIDIGTAKIATLIAVLEEGGSLRVVGASAVASQGVRKSQIVNLEETAAALGMSVDAAERMAGFSINQAYVSVGGRHIESQNSRGVVAVADPNGDITAEDVARVIEAARAVSLPANREILHVIPTSYRVDSQDGIKDPVGMSGVRLEAEAHIITASTTVLRNIRKCVEQLGIQVVGFVFSGLAASTAALSETERELGAVIMDVGAGASSVCAYAEGSLVFSGVLPIGATHITKDIALGSRVSIPSAEKIKLALAKTQEVESPLRLPDESREDARRRRQNEDQLDLQQIGVEEETRYLSRKTLVDGIIAPRLRELFDLCKEALSQQKVLKEVPSGLVVVGGGAETVSLLDAARKVLGLSARVGHPHGLRGLIDEIETPTYATTVGLLLYGKSDGQFAVATTGKSFSFKSVQSFIQPHKLAELFHSLWKMVLP